MQTNIKRISITSDGKRKSNQITLRNLLPDNLLMENNYVSLQSQRISSSVRPQTMYCDRIRKKLYPQSVKRQKSLSKRGVQIKFMLNNNNNQNDKQQHHLQQQNIRVVRNKSQNLKHRYLTTADLNSNHNRQYNYQKSQTKQRQRQFHSASNHRPNEQEQFNSTNTIKPILVTKQQKIKMKKYLGKINLLATKTIKVSQQQQIQTIFTFFDCLSKNQNFYQEAFTYIKDKLNKIIFLEKENLDEETYLNLRKVAEISQNKQIIQSVYASSLENRMTYKQLLNAYVKEIIQTQQKSHNLEITLNAKLQDLQTLLQQKLALIQKLTSKLSFYQSHPSQNKYPQLLQLKQQNNTLKKQIQQQAYQIRVLNHNLQLLHETRLMNENKIQDLKREIVNFQLEKQTTIAKVEKSSELKQFQDNVTMLKEMLDRSIIRMGGMKEEYDKLKVYNETLIDERDKLAKRAAVGFGELTPRPKYKHIFKSYNMNFNQVFDNVNQSNSPKLGPKKIPQYNKTNSSSQSDGNKMSMSTQNFVQTLIGKFKNYYQTYKVQQNQRQKSFQKGLQSGQYRKKKRLSKQKEKQKDIFENVMDDVYQTKNQVKKTLLSVEEVKIAYSKKQNDLLGK